MKTIHKLMRSPFAAAVKSITIASLAATLASTATLAGAADVGVSLNIAQPGFYGRVDIGDSPAPELLYPQPVVIQSVPAYAQRRPIYLHVPPAHARDWGRYCYKYSACNQPVYFVRDDWYNNVYVPRYREREGWGARHERREDRREVRHEVRHDDNDDHGHGRGHDREH